VPEPDPYQPPRAPIDGPPRADPPTIGYLIGALILAGSGVTWTIFSLVNGQSPIIGLFFGFFGVRALLKYRARTRTSRRGGV